jgi:methionyl-tRNA synthetase
MNKKTFYITTTLPYVNSDPHVGFAMEIIRADIIARYKRLMGHEVFFNTGTDEHGIKIYQKAIENNEDPQTYVDRYAEEFKKLKESLNLSYTNFIRTTDPYHIKAAQEFWKVCEANGDIYKKNYKMKYCVGCELEKTDSELVDGKCPLHPQTELQLIEEENYFFRFSNYQKKLLDLYEARKDFVLPDFRFNEIKKFVERGLEDFSISRLKSKMPWGIEVPNNPDHVMYVWFDALVDYISAIGWPANTEEFNKWWPVTQYAGKDNLRQQSAMWQAMLMSAKLEPSKQVVINGFITSNGQKMSKSLGNVISPFDLVKEFGTDAVRYVVARELSLFEDSDLTLQKFKDTYNGNLANGLGNLTSRILKMSETYLVAPVEIPEMTIPDNWKEALDKFEINKAADIVWQEITSMDAHIQSSQPFKLIKKDKEMAEGIVKGLVVRLYTVARMLNPILPETSDKIKALIKANKSPETPLFVRKD